MLFCVHVYIINLYLHDISLGFEGENANYLRTPLFVLIFVFVDFCMRTIEKTVRLCFIFKQTKCKKN